MVFSQFPNRWMGIGVVINEDESGTVSTGGDYEKVQENVKIFLDNIDGKNNIYVYGARNDSRRMYDALAKKGVQIKGLIVCDESENPEQVRDYNVVLIRDVADTEDVTIVMCYRESLRDEALSRLKNYCNINVIITDDKTASFIR